MTSATDPRDRIIQEHAPMVLAPNFSMLAPLARPGHRFIAARDRILLEVVRPWLHLVWPVTADEAFAAPLPYGTVENAITIAFGKVPRDLLLRFLKEANEAGPFEHAAWLVWDAREERLKYLELDITAHSEGRVTYNRPTLEEHESLAVDLHSHGALPAFFSAQDDADDAGEVKISGVVGGFDSGGDKEDEAISWKFRLCALGIYLQLPGPKDL